jgi:aminopeptidase N
MVIVRYFFISFVLLGTLAQSQDLDYFEKQYMLNKQEYVQHSLKSTKKLNIAPTDNQLKFDAIYYHIEFSPNFNNNRITGKMRMTAEALDDLTYIDLDLFNGMSTTGAKFNGSATSFSRDGDYVIITPAETIPANTQFNLEIFYSGSPQNSGFGSFTWSFLGADEVFWTLSEPYGARDWWPCKDTPTDKADSVRITVTVPESYSLASNGLIESIEPDGSGFAWTWVHRYPIATYLVAVAAYPYHPLTDTYHAESGWSMPLQHYVFPSNSYDDEIAALNRLHAMFDKFNEAYGDYPFLEEKYGIAQFGWGGGMEHQTMTFQSGFDAGLTAHELGHQWFGDNVTCANFHHIWLNEGFATFSEALYQEHIGGNNAYMNDLQQKELSAKGNGTPVYVANPSSVSAIFNYGPVYAKGAWVVHMLRRSIANDEVFFGLLQAWNSDEGFAGRSATTEDLAAFTSDYLGEDYTWFFDDWIYNRSYPRYHATFYNSGGVTYVQLEQSQADFFRGYISLEFSDGIETEMVRVFQSFNGEVFELNLGFAPDDLRVDPNKDLLREVSTVIYDSIDNNPLTTFRIINNRPNPFNPSTRIYFILPRDGIAELTVYTSDGRRVYAASEAFSGSGERYFIWNGKNNRQEPMASGVYFYQIKAESAPGVFQTKSGKMTLLK